MGNFASRFEYLRKANNLTQEELGKALGLSKSTICMYEKGARQPDHELSEQIADYFNVDLDYLFGREDKSTYYINPETAIIAQQMYENPDLKLVFDACKDLTPEQIQAAAALLKTFKGGQ